jgi:hypothetical protein
MDFTAIHENGHNHVELALRAALRLHGHKEHDGRRTVFSCFGDGFRDRTYHSGNRSDSSAAFSFDHIVHVLFRVSGFDAGQN